MNKQQQTTEQTIPAGFTERDWLAYNDGVDLDGAGFAEEQTWGVHDGPTFGGVHASWAAYRGFMLEVDGYGRENEQLQGDLTPRQARKLARDLLAAADAVEELQAPEVAARARELVTRRGVTISDLGRAAEELGVRVTTMYAAYEAAEHEGRHRDA